MTCQGFGKKTTLPNPTTDNSLFKSGKVVHLKSAGDFDTNAHPCRIGGADFLLYETTQQGGCKPIQDSELLEAFEPYIAAFLGK